MDFGLVRRGGRKGTPCKINDPLAILNLNFCIDQIIQDCELIISLGPLLLEHLRPHEHCVEVDYGLLVIKNLLVELLDVLGRLNNLSCDSIDGLSISRVN